MKTAKYIKLKDGTWGIIVRGEVKYGAFVIATRNDGKTGYERVGDFVEDRGQDTVYAIAR